jgi:signal transduction histidine kinase/ActR/RegA family two-component response regulator
MALRRGAQDYVLKQDLNPAMLVRVIRYSVERKTLARRLESANENFKRMTLAAEAANLAKSTFLANMSHEIRTPLTAILGFTEMVHQDRLQLPEKELDESLSIIRRNGDHLLSLINDILDLSKIEADELTLESLPVSPRDLIDQVVSLIRLRAEAKRLRIVHEVSSDVPAAVLSDPTRLRQILLNLASNAVKFTETGEVRLRGRCMADGQCQPATLSFDVTDTGIGVTPTQIDNLFQPFVQADTSTTRKFGGTGLGLTISRRLARLLGGDLTLESQIGYGSTFTLTVPAVACAPQVDAGEVNANTCDVLPLAGYHLLLVEDGLDNQRLIRLILEKAGAEVTLVENGKQAVDQFSTDGCGGIFDLILMDMQMPVMDGLTATRHIRDRGFHNPIIALTANAMSEDRALCFEAGCDDFVTKPIERDRFLRRLANALQPIAAKSASSTLEDAR